MVSSFCFAPLRPIPCFRWRLWLMSFVRPWLCRLFALMDFIGPKYHGGSMTPLGLNCR